MLKINKQTITLTKGDDASLRLVPRYKDRTEYVLTEGDSAVFRIKFGHTLVELQCTLNLETNKIVANITPNDTKDFNPGIYRYEAELITSFGFHYTFIADQTFILGQEYEQRITSTSNGNGTTNGNLPEIDGIVDGEPVVYGDIQPTNPMMDYEELNHLPKLNGKTIKGDKDNEYYGIPTKTSDLENDSDFVSDDDYVHSDNNYDDTAKNAVDALGTASTYDVPESGNASTSQVVKGDDSRLRDNRDPNPHTHSKADITDFPTNVSAFNNDSGFITNTVNNLANYYLKSETYTRAEVEQLIAAIKQGKFEIVAELPASGDANVIYLVPKSTAQTSNSYDEYVYINNAWEKIGDTDIDLSGYVTDDELTTALQSYLTTSAFNTAIASYYTKTETDNLLANKVDKVAGKGLSTNDYDNTAKGIVDGVTSALNDKVDKVQGKGLSTNDYDNTAKGIVDGVTSALAGKANISEMSVTDGTGTDADKTTIQLKSGTSATVLKTHQDISGKADKVSGATNGNLAGLDANGNLTDSGIATTDVEEMQDELSTDYATVEGNPINFSTLSAQKSKSTILSVEPIQDLHGYDKPWVGGAGKNLLPMTVDGIKDANTSGTWSGNVYTFNNATFEIITDNDNNILGFKVNTGSGGASDFAQLICKVTTALDNGRMIGCPSGGDFNNSYFLYQWRPLDGVISYDTGNGVNSSWRVNDNVRIAMRQGTQCNNLVFKPMLSTDLTISYASFQPYTNISSITGRTQIGILGCGKNLINPNTNVNGYFISESGVITSDIEACYTSLIKVDRTQSYILSGIAGGLYPSNKRVHGYDKDGNWLLQITYANVARNTRYNIPFTIPNECEFIRISYRIDDTNVQLEVGNQSTSYTAYQSSNDSAISIGQTVYGGTLDVENGVLVVEKVNINLGNLTWKGENTSVSGKRRFYVETPSNIKHGANGDNTYLMNGVCEICSVITTASIGSNNNGISLYTTSIGATIFYMYIDSYAEMTDIEFKTALDGVQLVYELATPITINLTPHTINLLKGVNNISTDGDKITLTYRDGKVATLGDLTSAVDSLDGKIEDSKILTDTVTGDKYILVVTNGVLDIQQISN